jgi:hypothetical protein
LSRSTILSFSEGSRFVPKFVVWCGWSPICTSFNSSTGLTRSSWKSSLSRDQRRPRLGWPSLVWNRVLGTPSFCYGFYLPWGWPDSTLPSSKGYLTIKYCVDMIAPSALNVGRQLLYYRRVGFLWRDTDLDRFFVLSFVESG